MPPRWVSAVGRWLSSWVDTTPPLVPPSTAWKGALPPPWLVGPTRPRYRCLPLPAQSQSQSRYLLLLTQYRRLPIRYLLLPTPYLLLLTQWLLLPIHLLPR